MLARGPPNLRRGALKEFYRLHFACIVQRNSAQKEETIMYTASVAALRCGKAVQMHCQFIAMHCRLHCLYFRIRKQNLCQ